MTVENNWCTLKVSDDKMWALMSLRAPEGDEVFPVTVDVIHDFLTAQGIVSGINETAVVMLAENVKYGQFVCVAAGKPATRGADGHFVFQMDTEDMQKKPILLKDGTADYKNALKLAMIKEGELLAIYEPAACGSAGYDVYGTFLPSLGFGKEAKPLRGKGIYSDEEKIHYYAAYSGHIVKEDTHISIEKLYRVSGDLNIDVGNIHFDGDVEVSGDMRSGLEIEATGDVMIHGHVGACKIQSGKNITIEKGIQGHDNCSIQAKGDIACRFIERCNMHAGGNIYADSVLNARLTADQQIVVTSRGGTAIGCEIYGMMGVVVKEAGNDAGTPTLLRTGLPRQEYERANKLSFEIKENEKKEMELSKHQNTIPDTQSQLKAQIMRAKIVLKSQRNTMMEELDALNHRIAENAQSAAIHITGTAHNGVRIYIGASPYAVLESVREVSYTLQNLQVLAQPLQIDK